MGASGRVAGSMDRAAGRPGEAAGEGLAVATGAGGGASGGATSGAVGVAGARAERLLGRAAGLGGKVARDSTVRASAVFACSGAAFALGNLLLARAVPVEAFAECAIAIALFNVFGLLAPLGMDQALLRHRVHPGPRLLLPLLLSGAAMGAAVGAAATGLGAFPPATAAALALAILAGGVVATAATGLRAIGRQGGALLAATAASWVLLLIGLAAQAVPMGPSWRPVALFAAGNLLAAGLGWIGLARHGRVPAALAVPIPRGEARSLLGLAAIGTLALQIERLLIPVVLDLPALALFSVLASSAIFPFRLLATAAGFTLTPKLRAAEGAARRRVLRRELLLMAMLTLAGTTAVTLVAPEVIGLLTAGRYEVDRVLVLVACFSGAAKVVEALPRAILLACGTGREIAQQNGLGIAWLAAVMGGMLLGSPWGLEGLLCGSGAGGLLASLPSLLAARRALRR